MRNIVVICAGAILLSSCSILATLSPAYQMSEPLSAYNVPDFQSLDAAMTWVGVEIHYYDEGFYWETPQETLQSQQGGGKAMTLLFMYIAHEQFGILPVFIGLNTPTGRHAVAYYNGVYYDPTIVSSYTILPPGDSISSVWYTYEQALKIANKYHAAIGFL